MSGRQIGIAGMGLLGRGIAACFLSKGFRVVAYSMGDDWRGESRRYVAGAMADLVDHHCATDDLLTQWTADYQEADSIADFRACEFVIESVPEDLDAKRNVLQQIESAVGQTVPIATNTSSIPIAELQQGVRHPDRLIGMHWAAPCYVSRFLEIIRGERTDEQTMHATLSLAREVGKDPSLLNKDVAGFIVNRLAYAMYREAFALVEAGVSDVETIDRAFRQAVGLWASIAGPFRWMDLTGLPSYAGAMGRLFPQLSNAAEVPETMRRLIKTGAKGIANGRGFYTYTPEQAAEWDKRLLDQVWRVSKLENAGGTPCG